MFCGGMVCIVCTSTYKHIRLNIHIDSTVERFYFSENVLSDVHTRRCVLGRIEVVLSHMFVFCGGMVRIVCTLTSKIIQLNVHIYSNVERYLF